ncbi:unnamed protein product [Trichogramma brassicae]|uniref:Uncharacterized protein n=1 Tax=Trichogramma brassicae TaxID=86971 RepID=A0A6H5IC55_9HYME|nr:unnamed protein product [Trichogramma brassicae]
MPTRPGRSATDRSSLSYVNVSIPKLRPASYSVRIIYTVSAAVAAKRSRLFRFRKLAYFVASQLGVGCGRDVQAALHIHAGSAVHRSYGLHRNSTRAVVTYLKANPVSSSLYPKATLRDEQRGAQSDSSWSKSRMTTRNNPCRARCVQRRVPCPVRHSAFNYITRAGTSSTRSTGIYRLCTGSIYIYTYVLLYAAETLEDPSAHG